MKKLLSILAIVGLTATAGASVVACSNGTQTENETKTVKFNMDKTNITISGDGNVIREITNFNDLKNVKAELIIADSVKNNVKVELDTVSPYETKLVGGALKVTTINTDKLLETTQGTIKLTADGVETTEITLNLIKNVKFNMDKTNITISGDGNVIREITNFNDLKNVKAELIIADSVKNNVKVELDTVSPYEAKLVGGALKVTTINTDKLLETTQGTIKLTADGVETTEITLNLIKNVKLMINTNRESNQSNVDMHETDRIQITNSNKLENLIATVKNESIATAKLELESSWLVITGISAGTTTVTLTADNAIDLTITVNVQETRFNLNTFGYGFDNTLPTNTIKAGSFTKPEIKRAIATYLHENVNEDFDFKNVLTVNGSLTKLGYFTVDVTKENEYVTGQMKIEVVKTDIKTDLLNPDFKLIYVKPNGYKDVKITNYQILENVKVSAYGEENINLNFDKETGIINIQGISESLDVVIFISANNATGFSFRVIIDSKVIGNLAELEKIIGSVKLNDEDIMLKQAYELVHKLVLDMWKVETSWEDYDISIWESKETITVSSLPSLWEKGIEAMLDIIITK